MKSQDKDNVIRILLQKECDGFEIINEEEIKESPVIQPKEETMVPTRALEEAKVPKRDLEEIKVPKRDLEEVKVYRRDLEDLRTHRPDLEESKE